jgi:hypothetical protein
LSSPPSSPLTELSSFDELEDDNNVDDTPAAPVSDDAMNVLLSPTLLTFPLLDDISMPVDSQEPDISKSPLDSVSVSVDPTPDVPEPMSSEVSTLLHEAARFNASCSNHLTFLHLKLRQSNQK